MNFYELELVLELAEKASAVGRVHQEAIVAYRDVGFPILSFSFGCEDVDAPVLAFIGGVHGLERVGTRVVLSYLRTVIELLAWDETMRHVLDRCRLVFYPLVNPAGMAWGMRSNPNGVDLMRNAPIDAESPGKLSLVAGHRISPALPWYRGRKNQPMQQEAQLLCDYVRRELWQSKFVFLVDVHSGFGMVDRFWFPYACSRRPFVHIDLAYKLYTMLGAAIPQHVYKVEPQSNSYITHGDIWDYLYGQWVLERPERVFLPLCLEMGSWLWVKKNPKQLFSLAGVFNPILPHRLQRTMRRHLVLFDFLLRSVYSHESWSQLSDLERRTYSMKAKMKWFSHGT